MNVPLWKKKVKTNFTLSENRTWQVSRSTMIACSGGPDLQIRGGPGHPDPEIRGAAVSKKCFSAPQVSVWSKNKGVGPLGPSPGSTAGLLIHVHLSLLLPTKEVSRERLVCNSAHKIPYWWHRFVWNLVNEHLLINVVILFFQLLFTNDRQITKGHRDKLMQTPWIYQKPVIICGL